MSFGEIKQILHVWNLLVSVPKRFKERLTQYYLENNKWSKSRESISLPSS